MSNTSQNQPATATPIKRADIETKLIDETFNPRGSYDADALKELARSIKKNGVIQAVTVRISPKDPKRFELVCGSRRLRASKIAGLATIPVSIRELTDAQAWDMKITENLQRADVHPMDEAVAFKALHELQKQSVKDIALRVAKSEDFVTGRLKLNDLIPSMQKEFYQGGLNIAQAFLIARLTAEDQKNPWISSSDGPGIQRCLSARPKWTTK